MAGAGSKQEMESFGNRNLWHFISGTGVLRPKNLIKVELERNQQKLLKGLLQYRKPRAPQGEQLKDKKLSKQQKDFVQKLSVFLNLDEKLSYELFCSYISQDFRGSQKNLQVSLSTERHARGLMLNIRDFYFSERIYLLQCIRHLLTYWNETEGHPYMDEYATFLNSLQADLALIKNLLDALEDVCDASLPTWETHGALMNDRQALIWAHQNLKEQHELLEIILAYWKDFEANVDDFIKLLERFKRQGFGRRQVYKHVLDDSMDRLLKRIGSLEVLVLQQMLDMESVERLSLTHNFADHSMITDMASFQRVDKVMQLLGSEVPHSPILLCWMILRQLFLNGGEVTVTRKMGNQALQLNIFEFITDMLDREPFCGQTSTASYAHYVVYTMLVAALTVFDETTMARNNSEMQVLNGIASKLLQRDFIAADVWGKGLDHGVGTLFKAAQLNFPLDFSTLVKLSSSLASANSASASKVLELWSELPRYTEYLDRNNAQDLKASRDSSVWQLARDKMPFTAGDFVIPKGVCGQLISEGRRSEMEIPVIQWQVAYDGWQLLKCEIQELLHQVSRGAGMVSPLQILRVTEITQFVKAICTSQPDAADGLSDIISLLYTVIQRFTSFTPPPLDLLAASLECATCVAKLHPKQAWHDMKQTGLLPYLTENIDNLDEVLSGQGLSPGLYGALLAGYESAQGRYPLTLAFLNLISDLVEPLYKQRLENELTPSVLYILREIFPVYQKWRYYNSTRKELIGQKCLDISHRILNILSVKEEHKSGRPQLQEICVYSLLFTEAGRALLEVVATGVETIEVLLAQQSCQSEGSGEDMIQLVQVAFSVLNRLLLLRPPNLPLSPVEVALSSQPVGLQNQHIVAIIAEYIYHRTSPLLSKLAMLSLKRLAVVLPMSILACLGNQAEPIRDIYLMRLTSATEDLSLKTGILELLSVCVDTQPGLIEVFLNVQSGPATSTTVTTPGSVTTTTTASSLTTGSSTATVSAPGKGLAVGKVSCLQTVLELMDADKQLKYLCPPDLLCACVDFVQALWLGMRETAMSALRTRERFWPSLCRPLFVDLPRISEVEEEMKVEVLTHRLKTLAYILKVLAQEIYCMHSSKLDVRLKKIMQDIATKERIKYLSTFITGCVSDESRKSSKHQVNVADNPTLKLLIAWKNFLVVLAKFNIPELQLSDSLKEQIILDLLTAVQSQFSEDTSPLTHRLSQNCSALFFTLVKSWISSVRSCQDMVVSGHEALAVSLTSGDMVIPSVQIGLVGALTVTLQHCRHNNVAMATGLTARTLRPVLVTVCEVLLQSTRELPAPKELRAKQDGKDKSFISIDHRLKLQIVSCCLVEELILQISDVEVWLPVLQEHYILTSLLSSAEIYLKAREGLQYMQTLFLLLLAVAKSEKGAEVLAQSGLTEHTCLPITYCYQNTDNMYPGLVPPRGETRKTSEPVTWQGVYCVCLELYATVLQALKFSFLENALNFVGSHQDRLQQALEITRVRLHPAAFCEAEKTCFLLCQLPAFSRVWRLHLPNSLNNMLAGMMYMCQTFVAYMIRPRYLQHVIEHQLSERTPVKKAWEPVLPMSLQHQTSTEDVDNPTSQLVQVQHSMMRNLGQSLAALRQFSPDLVQILIDQNMDIGEFEPLLLIGFSTPPVDQDTPPTFGTLLTCVNVCMRMLNKLEPRATSPQKSDTTSLLQTIPKSLLLFVLENALYLTMAQGMLYLKDPRVTTRDKQLLKRELGTEMNSFLSGIHRYLRRGGPQSPGNVTLPSPSTVSPRSATLSRSISQTFSSNHEQAIFRLTQEFASQVLR